MHFTILAAFLLGSSRACTLFSVVAITTSVTTVFPTVMYKTVEAPPCESSPTQPYISVEVTKIISSSGLASGIPLSASSSPATSSPSLSEIPTFLTRTASWPNAPSSSTCTGGIPISPQSPISISSIGTYSSRSPLLNGTETCRDKISHPVTKSTSSYNSRPQGTCTSDLLLPPKNTNSYGSGAASRSLSTFIDTSAQSSTATQAQSAGLTVTSQTPVSNTNNALSTTSTTASTTSTPVTSLATLTTSSIAQAPTTTAIQRMYPADVVDELRDASMYNLTSYLTRNPPSTGCTIENAAVRREWTDLSVDEREDYIQAVKCLQSKPPKSDGSAVPGAKSRFDDFVATHIEQTDSIHNTANFLSWHRYFIYTYEQALRNECGYQGYHPYWNWNRYAADPANSPLFNGNASSMSGNSVNNGCVMTGPFASMQVNLGPGSSLSYNPRCLKRDISASEAAQTTADKTHALITGSRDIGSFQNTMQAVPGVHAGGHFTIGGDPGGDIHASPGDPAFYLHHGMIDRVWWIWQMQDLATRLTEVTGTVAGSPGEVGSVNDPVQLGVNAGVVTIGDLLDTMGGLGGELCYIYV